MSMEVKEIRVVLWLLWAMRREEAWAVMYRTGAAGYKLLLLHHVNKLFSYNLHNNLEV